MSNYFTSQNSIFTVLDIGSGKICCVIAKLDKQNNIQILGTGLQEAKGIYAGSITDMKVVETCVRNCIASAEKMASIRVKNIILGFSSSSCKSEVFNIEIDLTGSLIKEADLKKSYEHLHNKLNAENKRIFHILPVQYSIDENNGIKNPIGMYGNKLGVEVSVISVENNVIKNFESLIKACDLDIKESIFSPYALGHSVLTDEEKELGSAIIDIGAELTTITIFLHGEIVFTKVISIGGNLVTKDISRIFSLSLEDSERIKIINGQLIEELENSLSIIEVSSLGDEYFSDSIEITRKDLISVIKPRIIEIISAVNNEINSSGYGNTIVNRLIFTGGVSQTDGIIDLINKVTGKKAKLSKSKNINGIPENMKGPSFSVINSLLNYSLMDSRDIKINKNSINIESKTFYNGFIKFKNWLLENF